MRNSDIAKSMAHLILQNLVFLWQATPAVFGPSTSGEFANNHGVCSVFKNMWADLIHGFLNVLLLQPKPIIDFYDLI